MLQCWLNVAGGLDSASENKYQRLLLNCRFNIKQIVVYLPFCLWRRRSLFVGVRQQRLLGVVRELFVCCCMTAQHPKRRNVFVLSFLNATAA